METTPTREEALDALRNAQHILNEAEADGRPLTPAEEKTVQRALLGAKKFELGLVTSAPNRPRVKAPNTDSKASSPEDAEYKEAFSRYMRFGVPSRALETKAQSEGTGSAGGYLVPNDFLAEVVNTVADFAPLLSVSRVVETDSWKLDTPRSSSHGSAAWTAENAAFNESDEVFATTTIQLYKATRIVKVSEELLSDEKVDVESYLVEEFGRAIGALVNTALTTGTGSSQPYGVVTQTPAGQIYTYPTGSATTVPADSLFEVFHKVKPQYRRPAEGVWMAADSTLKSIEQLKDQQDRYLWQAGIAQGAPPTLLGFPILVNPDIATMAANAKSLLFGNLRRGFYVARGSSISLQRLNERYADTGQVGFRIFARFGSDLLNTEAVAIGKNSAI